MKIKPDKISPTAKTDAPVDLPPPLDEPAAEQLRLETILAALADPLRMTIVYKLLHDSDAYDHPCGWFGFERPRSSLTHHFKTLREAGVIRQRQYGLERRSRLRREDLDARFPGLLALVENWLPPAAGLRRPRRREV